MKICFFEVQDWEKSYIENHFKNLYPIITTETLTQQNIGNYKDCEIISIFLGSHITPEIIDALPNLRFIATRSTGFDQIDINYCKKKNILVSNITHYGDNTVAEYAFGLILALSRKIIKAYENAKNLDFSCVGLTGFDLGNKTLGIIGVGNIGKHVVRIANGFNMRVIAYDKKIDENLAQKLNFNYVNSLEDLLSQADIISIHVPYNKHTHHLINKENIKLIKPGALFINTARGAIVDTEALLWGLDNSIISGAGLDVLEGESLIKEDQILLHKCGCDKLKLLVANYLLLKRDNVIITPHNAFNSKEAITRILKTTEENIRAFLNNRPINLVK